MHACMHMHGCTHACTCGGMCMCICKCMCVCTYTCMYLYSCMFAKQLVSHVHLPHPERSQSDDITFKREHDKSERCMLTYASAGNFARQVAGYVQQRIQTRPVCACIYKKINKWHLARMMCQAISTQSSTDSKTCRRMSACSHM